MWWDLLNTQSAHPGTKSIAGKRVQKEARQDWLQILVISSIGAWASSLTSVACPVKWEVCLKIKPFRGLYLRYIKHSDYTETGIHIVGA